MNRPRIAVLVATVFAFALSAAAIAAPPTPDTHRTAKTGQKHTAKKHTARKKNSRAQSRKLARATSKKTKKAASAIAHASRKHKVLRGHEKKSSAMATPRAGR